MGLFLLSLGILDVVLVLLVTFVAFVGRKQPAGSSMDPARLSQALQRARLQFAVVAAAWCLVLTGHLLILVFDVAPERAEIYLLLGQAILLLLALLFEISLYGAAPERSGPPPSVPEDTAA
ncbi:MAG TPA: hypothetical protein VGB18_06685 [Candidatus Thermoplasmatota archaeon]